MGGQASVENIQNIAQAVQTGAEAYKRAAGQSDGCLAVLKIRNRLRDFTNFDITGVINTDRCHRRLSKHTREQVQKGHLEQRFPSRASGSHHLLRTRVPQFIFNWQVASKE
eukprot:g82064.t1